MQREQALQNEIKTVETGDKIRETAFVVKQKYQGDSRVCYCGGEKGHIKPMCKLKDTECGRWGKRGHIEAVCKQSTGASGGVEEKDFAGVASGVALTAVGEFRDVQKRVWVVDSGSTSMSQVIGVSSRATESLCVKRRS